MLIFVFDGFFFAWLFIVVGGLTTTFCLYWLASRPFPLSDKKRLFSNEVAIKEESRFRREEDAKLKKMIIEQYTEMLKNQDDIAELKKPDNEKN